MSIRIVATALIALNLVGCASVAPPTDEKFSFGLWGDMPYKKAGDDPKLPAVLKSINASDIAFSIYDGDIKDGSSKCTDDVYTLALTMFNTLAKPLVYVPGDNEWTDCHRLSNGGYDGLERLAHLRKVMYQSLGSLGMTTMPLEHQGKAAGDKFIENVRFKRGPVMFAGFNVPGSNNNVVQSAKECSKKSARTAAQCDASNAEFLERDAANVQWLAQTFDAARVGKMRGIVLVIQADPGFDLPETEEVDESLAPDVSGYRNFIEQIVKQTERFDGQVMLVHGDTHFFKMDKPLYSPTRVLPNLVRVQTFGSPLLHWVKVTVDTQSDGLFIVQPVIVKQP